MSWMRRIREKVREKKFERKSSANKIKGRCIDTKMIETLEEMFIRRKIERRNFGAGLILAFWFVVGLAFWIL
jgi:hypothetical protein